MATAKLIPIDLLDGRRRSLKLTNTGLVRFEDFMGKPVDECLNERVTVKLLTTLLWACLLWEDKALTWDDASALIDGWIDASPDATPLDLTPKLLEALAECSYYRNRRALNGVPSSLDDEKKSPPPDQTPSDSSPNTTTQ